MTLPTEAYWREWGAGNARETLLLHCGNAHSGAWKGLAAHLEGDLHMVAPDHPGHGRSPAWDPTLDLHDQATGYARGAFPSDGPLDLIGHSFGATVALRLALENPDRIRSLTLIEPVLFCLLKGTALYDELLTLSGPIKSLIDAGDHAAAAEQFTQRWGNGMAWADIPVPQRDYITRCIHLIPASWPALYHDAGQHFTPANLTRLQCPVQLIRGDQSTEEIPLIHGKLSEALRAEDHVVPGAGHMVPITHPGVVAGLVKGFMEG